MTRLKLCGMGKVGSQGGNLGGKGKEREGECERYFCILFFKFDNNNEKYQSEPYEFDFYDKI